MTDYVEIEVTEETGVKMTDGAYFPKGKQTVDRNRAIYLCGSGWARTDEPGIECAERPTGPVVLTPDKVTLERGGE